MVKTMSKPKKYTIEFLNSLLLNYKAELIGEYSSLKQKSRIKFKCNCGQEREKTFLDIIKTGSYCISCCEIIRKNKMIDSKIANGSLKNNLEILNKLILNYNSELLGEYITLGQKTKIKFKCNCGQESEKVFEQIKKVGSFCKKCTLVLAREKHKNTCKINLGVEYPSQSVEVKEKIKRTNIKNLGVEYPSQSSEVKEKIKKTNKKNLGVEYPGQSNNVKEKIAKTNIIKYGVSCTLLNSVVKEKTNITNLERYGTTNPLQLDSIKDKKKQTCISRYNVEHQSQLSEIKDKKSKKSTIKYGVSCPLLNSDVKEKTNITNLERYGTINPLQLDIIKERKKLTFIDKYNVEHPMHNSEIAEKCSKKAYNFKKYLLPSSLEINVQGYEPWALDELLKSYKEEELIIGDRTKVPEIWWLDSQGKRHRYYVDIYILKENKLIEVKSEWTYNRKTNTNLEKIEKIPLACIAAGYKYEYWIYDSKGVKTVISEFANKQSEPILDLKDTLQEQIVNQI